MMIETRWYSYRDYSLLSREKEMIVWVTISGCDQKREMNWVEMRWDEGWSMRWQLRRFCDRDHNHDHDDDDNDDDDDDDDDDDADWSMTTESHSQAKSQNRSNQQPNVDLLLLCSNAITDCTVGQNSQESGRKYWATRSSICSHCSLRLRSPLRSVVRAITRSLPSLCVIRCL